MIERVKEWLEGVLDVLARRIAKRVVRLIGDQIVEEFSQEAAVTVTRETTRLLINEARINAGSVVEDVREDVREYVASMLDKRLGDILNKAIAHGLDRVQFSHDRLSKQISEQVEKPIMEPAIRTMRELADQLSRQCEMIRRASGIAPRICLEGEVRPGVKR